MWSPFDGAHLNNLSDVSAVCARDSSTGRGEKAVDADVQNQ